MLRFVVGRALLWSLIGAAIGAFGAIGLVGLIQTQLFGMDGGELWACSLPFREEKLIVRAGHNGPMENPAAFLDATKSFLATIAPE